MRQPTRFVWPLSTVSAPVFMKPCRETTQGIIHVFQMFPKTCNPFSGRALMVPSPSPQNNQSPALMRHQQTSPSGTSSSAASSNLPDVALLTFHLSMRRANEAIYSLISDPNLRTELCAGCGRNIWDWVLQGYSVRCPPRFSAGLSLREFEKCSGRVGGIWWDSRGNS